jgi:hypothetical protein
VGTRIILDLALLAIKLLVDVVFNALFNALKGHNKLPLLGS